MFSPSAPEWNAAHCSTQLCDGRKWLSENGCVPFLVYVCVCGLVGGWLCVCVGMHVYECERDMQGHTGHRGAMSSASGRAADLSAEAVAHAAADEGQREIKKRRRIRSSRCSIGRKYQSEFLTFMRLEEIQQHEFPQGSIGLLTNHSWYEVVADRIQAWHVDCGSWPKNRR